MTVKPHARPVSTEWAEWPVNYARSWELLHDYLARHDEVLPVRVRDALTDLKREVSVGASSPGATFDYAKGVVDGVERQLRAVEAAWLMDLPTDPHDVLWDTWLAWNRLDLWSSR